MVVRAEKNKIYGKSIRNTDPLRSVLKCPLCGLGEPQLYNQGRFRTYWRCSLCHLVFVPPDQHLDSLAESSRYALHQNRPDNPGYVNFLSRLAKPLVKRLCSDAVGLDFGCGPGPVLAEIIREAGHSVDLFDPFFAKKHDVFNKKYDFITSTEVFEHLYNPGAEISRLVSMLNKGGILGVMTKLVVSQEHFGNWHYKNDKTHVCFYSRGTFDYLADVHSMNLEYLDKDIIFLLRPSSL